MQWSEWIECVLEERKEGSSWSVEVVVIAGRGRHFQLAGCWLFTARWDSVGCGEYVVQCMQFTDTLGGNGVRTGWNVFTPVTFFLDLNIPYVRHFKYCPYLRTCFLACSP